MSAFAQRRLEDKYTEMLVRLREECNLHAQQNGALQQQLRQAHDLQTQMREHYGKEAQKHIDLFVDNAARREAELVVSMQA